MKCESIHATHAHALIGLQKFQKHLFKDLVNFNSTENDCIKWKSWLKIQLKTNLFIRIQKKIAQQGEVTLNIRKTFSMLSLTNTNQLKAYLLSKTACCKACFFMFSFCRNLTFPVHSFNKTIGHFQFHFPIV